MIARLLMRLYVTAAAIAAVGELAYIYLQPPESMRRSADGVPYFSSRVSHPVTGEPLRLNDLAQHYKGARR